MQSEILFIAKFGGLCVSVLGYLFWVIKPMAIFNERQKQNKADIEDLKSIKDEFIKLKTEHELKSCGKKKNNG
jgi:hypothetical protein